MSDIPFVDHPRTKHLPDCERPEVKLVEDAITSRRSVRDFLPNPVSSETVLHIIETASRAASGNNTQPWFVRVVMGASKEKLTKEILDQLYASEEVRMSVGEFDSYPKVWKSPYQDRRKKLGIEMYTILGIQKGDRKGMLDQMARNFMFFDAPIGLIFSVDRVFVPGSAIDLGIFVGNIMTMARALNLDTCLQAAFGVQHKIVREVLGVPPNEVIMCGMSLGQANRSAPLYKLTTVREPLETFVTVLE